MAKVTGTRGGVRPNSGMPPKYGEKTVRLNVRVPETLHKAVVAAAHKQGLAISEEVVNTLYERYSTGAERAGA